MKQQPLYPCTATTRRGERCKRSAPLTMRCWQHAIAMRDVVELIVVGTIDEETRKRLEQMIAGES